MTPVPTPSDFADALILTGPTGSGKSAVALEVSERLGAEILALDSMTLYRGMDVGTAKPTAAERSRVPHHLIDLLDPWESGSVAWWLGKAAEACREVRGRGKRPLFVGGTPFYLMALRHGLFEAPPADPVVRAELEAEAERVGNVQLHRRLGVVDPKSASRLHPNDVRRVVRALEVYQTTGRPISAFQQTWTTPTFANPTAEAARSPNQVVQLEWPRDELYRRIEARVDAMLAAGWVDEVQQLLALPHALSREAGQALGYRELRHHLEGGSGWEETVAAIKTRTRQFAKRQLTWFRHLPGVMTVPADQPNLPARVLRGWCEPT